MRQQEVNMKISTEVIIALLASFAISVVLSPIIIPFLKRLKIGQTERTEGVQSHLEKAGTPTMGGLIRMISPPIVGVPAFLCPQISEHHPGSVSDTGFWYHRISG